MNELFVQLAAPIWDKFLVGDDCWPWTGVHVNGYGRVWSRNAKWLTAHRIVYQELTGETIPADFHLDHLCRNTSCVRPDHLEPVTAAENVKRGIGMGSRNWKGKTVCINGHPLTPDNLVVHGSGQVRRCRQCRQRTNSASRQRTQKGA